MTQPEKLIAIMGSDHTGKWYFPYEFMQTGMDNFVGYKAPTRLNELEVKYPLLFQRKQEDKYIQRRINWDDYYTWIHVLPDNLKKLIVPPEAPKAVSWLND